MLGEFIGEVVFETLLGSIWHAVKACTGFVYLNLRYWRPRRVLEQLAQRYGGRYATAGSALITSLMQGLGVVLLLVLAATGLFALGSAIWSAIG
ncbi:hypothetical protein D0N36_07885 [Hymenobacter lapidiphilus]|uniref:hypothetical protein n=1 Tax=Hymenobacter sp. CCM 8763 TaxID=2303334 RepID=UPI000E3504E8|nr:hypothetical protein [Hymenobacter sp. CCM 8763]RFP65609.1 hypothetical protein D0N36_07885 [Hymenobacter sp. CCM 8763]